MKRPLFFTCLLLVILSAILLTLYEHSYLGDSDRQFTSKDNLSQYDKSELVISGKICQKSSNTYYLKQVSIYSESDSKSDFTIISSVNSTQRQIAQKLIFECDENVAMPIGSTVIISGTLRTFSHSTNPGQFDAKKYYDSIGVAGKIINASIISCDGKAFFFPNLMVTIRDYLKQKIYEIYPQNEGGILCDIILGEKKEINSEIKDLYQRNGIAHILSISSLHVSILGIGLYKLLRKLGLPPAAAGLAGLFVLLFYGLLTGMSLSAIRAIGMYGLKVFADILDRTYDAMTALGIMSVIVLCVNVNSLNSCGFLLSFGSAAGIHIFAPAMQKRLSPLLFPKNEYKVAPQNTDSGFARNFKDKLSIIRNSLVSSLIFSFSITLTTLPIQLYFYYEIPTYSILINLIVLPLMTFLFISGLISIIIPGLGFVGTLAYYILLLYEKLCKPIDLLPFHSWNPGRPQAWAIILYYLLWLSIIGWPQITWMYKLCIDKLICQMRNKHIPCFSTTVMLAILPIMLLVLSFPKLSKGTIIFLDVGQGDGIITYTSAGDVYLFDGGSSSSSKPGQYIIKPALKYYGLSHIDAIFVSHPDTDHCNGIIELLENKKKWNFRIDNLYLSDCDYDTANKNVSALSEFENVTYISAGDYWNSGEDLFLCLSPNANYAKTSAGDEPEISPIASSSDKNLDINETSEVFLIISKKSSLLLTGDIQGTAENEFIKNLQSIMATYNLQRIDVLKVAHHGSKYSTPGALLDIISPTYSVISSGKNNRYGHPHTETLNRLEESHTAVLRTDTSGAIMLKY